MSARRATPMSGSPIHADLPASRDAVVHQLRHRTWVPDQPVEERAAVRRTDPPARRRSASISESFFDLAQRYHKLREAAFKSRSTKAATIPPPPPTMREHRLTDLPPPLTEEE